MIKPPLLLTGAHGFIGTLMSRHLTEQGYRVFHGDFDVTQPKMIEKFSQQCPENVVILHLAGIVGVADCERDPVVAHQVNADGPVNVFKAFPKSPRFIFFSSHQVYKEKSTAISEADPLEPKSVYAQSKRAAEIRLQALAAGSDTRLTILRLSNHVHKTQGRNTFMARVYQDLLEMRPPGSSLDLRIGNLNLVRDLGAIQDVNSAVGTLLQSEPQKNEVEIFNLCSGVGKNLSRIVEKLAARVGVQPKLKPDPSLLRAEPFSVVGDPSRFCRHFGWQPQAVDEDKLIDCFVSDIGIAPRSSRS